LELRVGFFEDLELSVRKSSYSTDDENSKESVRSRSWPHWVYASKRKVSLHLKVSLNPKLIFMARVVRGRLFNYFPHFRREIS
jgi:hypothetical protein